MPHKKTIGRFETKLKSASIKGNASAQSNPQTITRLTSHAIKLIRAASINKDLRNKVSELPNTFCVLMLLNSQRSQRSAKVREVNSRDNDDQKGYTEQ